MASKMADVRCAKWWVLGGLLSLQTTIYADQFHYNNFILGDRAAGLGGAFCAVSDGASGVHYNPAGIAFALSNEISGSANAFYRKNTVYKKAAYEDDFVEESQGSVAPFVGALGKLDQISPGLIFAFGIMTLDADLKDQDTLIEKPDLGVRFHRTANIRASTNKVSFAIGKRWGGVFAMGIGVSYLWLDELSQTYQDSTSIRQGYEVDDNGDLEQDSNGDPIPMENCCFRTLTQNIRDRLTASGVEPVLGFQFIPHEKVALGLTVKKAMLMKQNYEIFQEQTVHYYDATGTVRDAASVGYTDNHRPTPVNVKNEKPLGDWPLEGRAGLAFFANTRNLITADVAYYGAAKGDVALYDRDPVLNYAVGYEVYTTPSLPLRLGLFTNNDARPQPKEGKVNQPDSINYVGGSMFLAFVQPNSQIALGGVYQSGKGKAQKVSNSATIQDVEAYAWNVGFSISHNF